MLISIISTISQDRLLFGFSIFASLFILYMVIMKIHVFSFQKRYDRKPVHYKFFRIYSKSLITNSPSKKEKNFYAATNKMTYFFNSLLICSFVVFLYFSMK